MKALLFDADGVLTLPEEFFSRVYARSHGLDEKLFDDFIHGPFRKTSIGQADLRELILEYADLWQHEDPDAIMKQWFESEDIRNEPLLKLVQELRGKGVKCYLATNQEKYRGTYMKEVMFPGLFDGYFISYALGVVKPNIEYYQKVLAAIQNDIPELQPSDILFFDDSQENVDGAAALGIDARLYEGVEQVRTLIQAI